MQATIIKIGKTKFRLISTDDSSVRYGPCEICGKHCSEVFIQTKYTQYAPGQFTHDEVLFGHEKCLKRQQKKKRRK